MEIGKTIMLAPVSKHGKNRIAQQGPEWVVRDIREKVSFDNRPGPWLGIESLREHPLGFRWVHATSDSNFKIVKK